VSVISLSTKLLFCEGKPDSLDYAILARLVGNPNIVIPAGGKYGLGAFIQGRLSSYLNQKPSYLAFRDRDFDAVPPWDQNGNMAIPLVFRILRRG
jgi:hypothetical protein